MAGTPKAVENIKKRNIKLYVVGFQRSELVWYGHLITSRTETGVYLTDGKAWPGIKHVPFTLEQLEKGVNHDEFTFALSLSKAIEIRTELSRKRKERADREWSKSAALQKAVTNEDMTTLESLIAEVL